MPLNSRKISTLKSIFITGETNLLRYACVTRHYINIVGKNQYPGDFARNTGCPVEYQWSEVLRLLKAENE